MTENEYACNACRDSPDGERVLINPSKSFTQSNGRYTTCGELQEWVQDVQPSGGSQGEAELCGLTQYLAWFHDCDCEGPDIPPLDEHVNELNPSCDICKNKDFDYVPEPNREKLTDTGCCGKHNCDGLYFAAAKGVIQSDQCPTVQKNSGPTCCNLAIVTIPLVSSHDDTDDAIYTDDTDDAMYTDDTDDAIYTDDTDDVIYTDDTDDALCNNYKACRTSNFVEGSSCCPSLTGGYLDCCDEILSAAAVYSSNIFTVNIFASIIVTLLNCCLYVIDNM